MRWFPLYSLPDDPPYCPDCQLVLAGRRPVTAGYWQRRAAWLQSGPALAAMERSTWEQARAKGKRERQRQLKDAKKYRERQRRKWMKRFMKKINRAQEQRDNRIREVLERAAQD